MIMILVLTFLKQLHKTTYTLYKIKLYYHNFS